MVEPITVIVQSRLDIKILRREAVAEDVGESAGLRDRADEVVVDIRGDNHASLVDVLHDVAVAVVDREVEAAISGDGEETADATGSLKGVGEIESPEVLDLGHVGGDAVDGGGELVDDVPVVPHEVAALDEVPSFERHRQRGRRSLGDGESLDDLRDAAVAPARY